MHQRSVFTVIGVILMLQGIAFYFMATNVVSSAFPNLDEAGKSAPGTLMEVMGVMSFAVGLITFAARNTAEVLWAFCLGFALFTLVSLKHLFIDHINVPIPAIVIQVGIVLVCGYLWMQGNKAKTA